MRTDFLPWPYPHFDQCKATAMFMMTKHLEKMDDSVYPSSPHNWKILTAYLLNCFLEARAISF